VDLVVARVVAKLRATPPKHYYELDEDSAKVLYACLKLQHRSWRRCKGEFPEASIEALIALTGVDKTKTYRDIMPNLKRAEYILSARTHKRGGPEVYEVNVKKSITNGDTARMLLALMDFADEKQSDETTADPEGKVLVTEFVKQRLEFRVQSQLDLEERPGTSSGGQRALIEYLSPEDIVSGDERSKSKIDELAEAGEHIERVSRDYIRPRLRLHLERLYLKLLAKGIEISKLRHYAFDRELDEWTDRSS